MRSVANTRKITKAMELVAGAKMRKSVQLVTKSLDYSTTIQLIVENLRGRVDSTAHPFLKARSPSRSTLVVVAASDRGLCGGYNSSLVKHALEFLRLREEPLRVVTVGRRAERAVMRAGYPIFASFEAMSNSPSVERARPVGALLTKEWLHGAADRVFLVSMHFKSAVLQIPTVRQLLPIVPERELNKKTQDDDVEAQEPDLLFEPSPNSILEALLPRLLDTQVYQALLESVASEHAARMMAMRNATDNASDMLQDLSFTFHQARQATITREISEISAGKAVIE